MSGIPRQTQLILTHSLFLNELLNVLTFPVTLGLVVTKC